MRSFGFFERRFRGFRVVELGALGVLLVLILTVYLAKTGAGGRRADIERIQDQIYDEQTQIRMLKAEVASLEQPERLETLSNRYLGLEPISARREVTPQGLQDVARIAMVDHKAALVGNDPLTQPGSPDRVAATSQTATPQTATPQTATPQTATPQTATPQTATPQTAPATAAASPAAAPKTAAAPAPATIKFAKADLTPHRPAARAPAHDAKAASIDSLLQASGSAR
jgi:cell division protein FtsL